MAKKSGLTRLRNIDFTDRELLFIMDEVADENGLVHPEDVADRLGIEDTDGKRTPAGTVSNRLSWMRRYGLTDRVLPQQIGLPKSERARYIITSAGRALMGGRITSAMLKELEKGDPGTELLLMREVSRRAYVNGSVTTAAAVRREWMHNAAMRAK